MAWGDVGKKKGGSNKTFVRIPEDGTVILRMLDEEPVTIRQHKLSQVKGGEEHFMTLNCAGEDCFVCERAGNRYPPVDQWVANVMVFSGMEDQKEQCVRILIGGPQIWNAMKNLFETYGDVRSFDVSIKKQGKGRDTEYITTASPKSRTFNVAKFLKDEADQLLDIEEAFEVFGPQDQERMIRENGIDIDYDAVFERMRTMGLDEAMKTKVTFGKKSGKTIREIYIEDPRYLSWMAQNVTSNTDIAAAARLVVEHGTKKDAPKTGKHEDEKPRAVMSKQKGASTRVSAAAPPPETLVDKIRSHLSTEEPYASSIDKTAALIEKYGKGKRRLDQFKDEDLKALAKHLKIKG